MSVTRGQLFVSLKVCNVLLASRSYALTFLNILSKVSVKVQLKGKNIYIFNEQMVNKTFLVGYLEC